MGANFLHHSEYLSAGDWFRVHLRHSSARTMLMDSANFQAYRSGGSFSFYGGWPERSPIDLVAPHSGTWHLVLDLEGGSGSINHSLEVFRNQLA